jgi:ubiquinone/menaquinone biosynthesis C-methylase UbiE
MEAAGFADVRWESLSLGIAAIHVGVKRLKGVGRIGKGR